MSMIFCDENCIYQREGNCILECAAAVTNSSESGCMHRIRPAELLTAVEQDRQQHPEWYEHQSNLSQYSSEAQYF